MALAVELIKVGVTPLGRKKKKQSFFSSIDEGTLIFIAPLKIIKSFLVVQ